MHVISNQRFMVLMDRLLKVFWNIQVSSTSGSDKRFFPKLESLMVGRVPINKNMGIIAINQIWLVVLTILKHISQWEGLSQTLWKIKNDPNHQPVIGSCFSMENNILVIQAIFQFQFLLVISNKGTNGFGVH